jgi:hypothetical protein
MDSWQPGLSPKHSNLPAQQLCSLALESKVEDREKLVMKFLFMRMEVIGHLI